MIGTILFALLQVFAPDAAPTQEAPPAEITAPVPAKDAAKAEPKVVCTLEPITGVRARKMKVCRTEGYEKKSERDRDNFRSFITRGGNIQPVLPPSAGG